MENVSEFMEEMEALERSAALEVHEVFKAFADSEAQALQDMEDSSLEKKRERARDYARRKRKELLFVREKAVLIYNELVRMGVYSQLSPEAKEFFNVYKHREDRASYPYPPTMYKMFGKLIAPGASVTLREAMARLYKGKNEINMLCRRWQDKHGVHIEQVPADSGAALDTVYRISRIEPKLKGEYVENVSEIMSRQEQSDFRKFESKEAQ